MACEEMTRHLIDLIYGELTEEARDEIEAHLRACEGCRLERGRLQEASAALRRYAEADPLPEPGSLVLAPPGATRGWRRPLLAAGALAATVLLALALSNARLRSDAEGWTLSFSLLPRPAGAPAPGERMPAAAPDALPAAGDGGIAALLEDRLARERRWTESLLDNRLQAERDQTLEAFARALARQEQMFTAGLRSERDEGLRRDRAVEEMVGSEITRTQQMLGAVLAAARPAVIEQ